MRPGRTLAASAGTALEFATVIGCNPGAPTLHPPLAALATHAALTADLPA